MVRPHRPKSPPEPDNRASTEPGANQVTRRYLDPYGRQIGGSGNWPGDHAFLDKPTDTTGLTQVGARYYDSTTARFISVDPVMDLTDPQQWHGYAYASNNPLTNSDPSGLLRARPGAGSVKQTMRRQTPHERRLEPAMQEPGTRTGWLDDIDWETVAKGVMLGLAVVGIAAACIGSAGGFCAIAAGVGGAMSLTATEAVVAGTVVVAAGYLAIQGPSLSNSSPLMLNESSGTGANSSGNAHISPAREEHIAGNHGPGVQEEAVTRGYETADIPGEFLDDFLYNSNDELVVGQRIEEAVNRAPRPRLPNPNGPGEIINVDFGEIVGNAGGGRCSPTSWVQVVIRGGNNIWTAYPIVAP